jgi:hypothetical protein
VGCGDGWDLEDFDSWMDANIFVISGTHEYPNPLNANQDLEDFQDFQDLVICRMRRILR